MRIAVAKYQEEIKAVPIDTPHSNGCHLGLPVLVVESLLGISTTHSEIVETALAGWRTSADGPLLCLFSLLTGNFTGNFAKSRHSAR